MENFKLCASVLITHVVTWLWLFDHKAYGNLKTYTAFSINFVATNVYLALQDKEIKEVIGDLQNYFLILHYVIASICYFVIMPATCIYLICLPFIVYLLIYYIDAIFTKQ